MKHSVTTWTCDVCSVAKEKLGEGAPERWCEVKLYFNTYNSRIFDMCDECREFYWQSEQPKLQTLFDKIFWSRE